MVLAPFLANATTEMWTVQCNRVLELFFVFKLGRKQVELRFGDIPLTGIEVECEALSD